MYQFKGIGTSKSMSLKIPCFFDLLQASDLQMTPSYQIKKYEVTRTATPYLSFYLYFMHYYKFTNAPRLVSANVILAEPESICLTK